MEKTMVVFMTLVLGLSGGCQMGRWIEKSNIIGYGFTCAEAEANGVKFEKCYQLVEMETPNEKED